MISRQSGHSITEAKWQLSRRSSSKRTMKKVWSPTRQTRTRDMISSPSTQTPTLTRRQLWPTSAQGCGSIALQAQWMQTVVLLEAIGITEEGLAAIGITEEG